MNNNLSLSKNFDGVQDLFVGFVRTPNFTLRIGIGSRNPNVPLPLAIFIRMTNMSDWENVSN